MANTLRYSNTVPGKIYYMNTAVKNVYYGGVKVWGSGFKITLYSYSVGCYLYVYINGVKYDLSNGNGSGGRRDIGVFETSDDIIIEYDHSRFSNQCTVYENDIEKYTGSKFTYTFTPTKDTTIYGSYNPDRCFIVY